MSLWLVVRRSADIPEAWQLQESSCGSLLLSTSLITYTFSRLGLNLQDARGVVWVESTPCTFMAILD